MDVTALIKAESQELGLEAVARKDALAGFPAQGASGLTVAETNAVAAAESCAKKELEAINELVGQTQKAGAKCQDVLAKSSNERQGIEHTFPPTPPALDGLAKDRDSAVAAYKAFKADHELARDATGDDRLKQGLWAAVIIVLEGLVNSYFYAPVSAFGLLGGFFIAFFVSFANVSFAFMGGAGGLRYLSHIDPLRKLWGVLVSLFCLFVCLLVVSLSTFYRAHVDLLRGQDMDASAMETEAWRLATESLRNLEVWELIASVNSFLLVLVGLVCAIFAFYKGWEFDDPYPGLGRAFRAKERATQAYEDAQHDAAEAKAAWCNSRIEELHQLGAQLDEAVAEHQTCLAGLAKKLAVNSRLGKDTAQLAHGLLGIYRKKNAEVRADAAPSYFDVLPDEVGFKSFDDNIADYSSEASELKSQATDQQDGVKAEKGHIKAAVAKIHTF